MKRGTVNPTVKIRRSRKTAARIENIIKIKANRDPRRTAADINKLRTENPTVNVSDMLIRARLIEANLLGRRIVKKHLHLQVCLRLTILDRRIVIFSVIQ